MSQSGTHTSGRGSPAPDLPPQRLPEHVAIIMDGNGRWAQERNQPRIAGHRAGARSVREVVMECSRLGIKYLTLYSFSTENWKRPHAEVRALMELCVEYLAKERQELTDNNIRFLQIGRREGLPKPVLDELDATTAVTAGCTGLTLCLAINYSSRTEITDAVRAIAAGVKAGRIDPDAIEEHTVSAHLYTAGVPDPDLLIRTAGELRDFLGDQLLAGAALSGHEHSGVPRAHLGDQVADHIRVAHVPVAEMKSIAVQYRRCEIVHVARVGQRVEHVHRQSRVPCHQHFDEMRANKARAAGNQNRVHLRIVHALVTSFGAIGGALAAETVLTTVIGRKRTPLKGGRTKSHARDRPMDCALRGLPSLAS